MDSFIIALLCTLFTVACALTVVVIQLKQRTNHTLKMYADSNVYYYYFDSNMRVKDVSNGNVGYDLFIKDTTIVLPGETVKLPLGVYCESVDGIAYDLRCRSSIYKTKLRLCNGVGTIDANYRGEICACVDNIGTECITVTRGDRLFQLVFGDGVPITIEPVLHYNDLSNTDRGANGFGSTGK
jgi:dUTP pyrophosphatase